MPQGPSEVAGQIQKLIDALIFLVASELGVRHSSATIPLRVSLFLLEIPSAAARTSFS